LDQTEQPRILLVATLWWPLSARLAARFVRYGGQVSAICPAGHVLHHVPGMRRHYRYRALDSRASLVAAIEAAKPDIIVPCDDRAVWQLHELHGTRPDLRHLIESSLGRASEFEIIGARLDLLETAQALGIRVPETRQVHTASDLRTWFAHGPRPSVLKTDGTWGGSGVKMVDSEKDALAVYASGRRDGVGTTLKRLLVNGDPLARWTLRKQRGAPVTVQEHISGRPANAMVACWRGEALATVSVEVLSSQGTTGAGIVVRHVENREIARAARLLVERLGMSGFCGLDFVISAATGGAYLIELNPRCTQLGHLALLKRGDLAGVLYEKLTGKVCKDPPAPIGNDTVAFFPQALLAEPPSRFVSGAHLDAPWEQPSLMRELMLPSRPDRHWIARLYHHSRPPRSTPTVDFDDPAAQSTESTPFVAVRSPSSAPGA
jgi:hypothetical protein